jgi:pimeloyl-ACP methyl ester carboxylesterase
MTSHFFENDLVKLHYYRFGNGAKTMLCFHGFGMHGKQFCCLSDSLGDKYTFIGLDLFFHKQTELKDSSLANVKSGITKVQLAQLIEELCTHLQIEQFSVMGYSMGTHYATAITEQLGHRIDEYIVAAPSSINPGRVVKFFSRNALGNTILQKLMLNDRAVFRLINALYFLRVLDEPSRNILRNEVATPKLRFAFYACFSYLRYLETHQANLINSLQKNEIKSIFIFGKRDKTYPLAIANQFFSQFRPSAVEVLDENHELITTSFVNKLSQLL